MHPDPEENLWQDYIAQSYFSSNYGRGLAGWLMRKGHVELERDFHPGARFEKVLEVGAGEGVHLPFVRHSFSEYLLTDKNISALERVRFSLPPGVTMQVEDSLNLSFPDHVFDRVIAAHLLEHLPHPHLALREWYRVLKPGGVLSLILPCDPGVAWRLARCFGPRARARSTGINYDYWMAREHLNSIYNLLSYIRFYFDFRREIFLPLRLPLPDMNLLYVCTITV